MRREERKISDPVQVDEIISKADVCRIAMANDDLPYIVTLNFGYVVTPERVLYFHCAGEGRKLEMIKRNSLVCFEMDIDHQVFGGAKGCDWGMKYRSVVGYGNISIVTGNEERQKGISAIMRHYGGEREYYFDENVLERTTILRLLITGMTGKMC